MADDLAAHLGHHLTADHETKVGRRRGSGAATLRSAELENASKQAGNIPPDADQRRRLIAEGTGIPAGRLQYIGELLDIRSTHRGVEQAPS